MTNFTVLTIVFEDTADGVKITCTTNIACHLYCYWTATEPRKHLEPVLRRGLDLMTGLRYCFVTWTENEQEEAGDTLTHTFIKEPWPSCETRWITFRAKVAGEWSPSATAIFHHHHVAPPFGPPITVKFYPDAHPEVSSVDGWVMQLAAPSTWTFLVNAPGNFKNDTLDRAWTGYKTWTNPGTFEILARAIYLFDTSILPPGCLIESAKISLLTKDLFLQNGGSLAFNIFSSNPASNTALAFEDYATLGSVKYSTDVPYAALAIGVREELLFNAAGLAAITKGGISKFGIREVNYDLPDISPPWNGSDLADYWVTWTAETIIANKPFLEVTYREAL